jgi:DNA-directed RNA polymerase subunit RPC12/RpoP
MTDIVLKPCPACGNTDYRYAFSMIDFFVETASAVPNLLSQGTNVVAIGRIIATVGSGLGIFSLPKLFYQEVFEEIESTPLLRCKHCQRRVIMCPKCGEFLMLKATPKTAELIECSNCNAQFGHCESSDEFDDCM